MGPEACAAMHFPVPDPSVHTVGATRCWEGLPQDTCSLQAGLASRTEAAGEGPFEERLMLWLCSTQGRGTPASHSSQPEPAQTHGSARGRAAHAPRAPILLKWRAT